MKDGDEAQLDTAGHVWCRIEVNRMTLDTFKMINAENRQQEYITNVGEHN